ncbi:ferric reductase-like transmembrane domain-containing protein [Rudaeicoccus suwonensis]|uniref:Ferric reductase like protein n=1 Tax=Rudaeicoccus suwonensis TaxID=657409 RepID=A0A561E0U2_9MICO|nr:ferric reductase-like transmembrane domain-containing protein [Rudaeicoccus suwonensis]TWE09258.1 ferric reductase like protein [Rudaeicoccus suwonensis]
MTVLWNVSRATGLVGVALMTAVVILGVVLSGSRRRTTQTGATIQAVHRSLALGMITFLVVHIATAILDTYVHIGLLAAVVPFASGYDRLTVGLGTIGFDLLAALIVTSLARHRISEHVWRFVHRASFAMWPVTIWHGIAMSSDPVLRMPTIACAVLGTAAIIWRAASSHSDSIRRREVLRQEWT